MGLDGQRHVPAALALGKTRYSVKFLTSEISQVLTIVFRNVQALLVITSCRLLTVIDISRSKRTSILRVYIVWLTLKKEAAFFTESFISIYS